MLLFTLLMAAAVVSIQGKVLPGNCNVNVSVEKNFNLGRYLGQWYEMYRYEQPFQAQMDCVTANYITNGTSGIIVFNQGVINKKLYGLNGTAIPDPNAALGEAKLLVSFPGNMTRSPYWVLKTNYNTYSVVYACQNLNNGSRSITGWVLSRGMHMNLTDTNEVIQVVNQEKALTGLEWADFRHTTHDSKVCNSSSVVYPSVMLLVALFVAKFF